ncbi:uncharacterized protein C8Q71DRAFT_789161 [Rhodofomes roseus]|uniref:Uncharacterized protein n=1 Tax=Rhodofomes roseus TaxID=34475 RepID=A0ABQ8JX13_9APHY|nr:uncharacterized protein C8Q71DRAFT_793136 [Rhodofomes roseus]XP_047773272.1 uncharacterized protein C8Q71DRAFT_789161 [Rhodofomes roseus]KAH9828593.1 hypothetical protein C8Q71DRAFT_793136 [Rhodofomes roseus]KAH9829909.1 hypothetical protein C8Q71DRAFT_789161 [Rhodofomes roseus]
MRRHIRGCLQRKGYRPTIQDGTTFEADSNASASDSATTATPTNTGPNASDGVAYGSWRHSAGPEHKMDAGANPPVQKLQLFSVEFDVEGTRRIVRIPDDDDEPEELRHSFSPDTYELDLHRPEDASPALSAASGSTPQVPVDEPFFLRALQHAPLEAERSMVPVHWQGIRGEAIQNTHVSAGPSAGITQGASRVDPPLPFGSAEVAEWNFDPSIHQLLAENTVDSLPFHRADWSYGSVANDPLGGAFVSFGGLPANAMLNPTSPAVVLDDVFFAELNAQMNAPAQRILSDSQSGPTASLRFNFNNSDESSAWSPTSTTPESCEPGSESEYALAIPSTATNTENVDPRSASPSSAHSIVDIKEAAWLSVEFLQGFEATAYL